MGSMVSCRCFRGLEIFQKRDIAPMLQKETEWIVDPGVGSFTNRFRTDFPGVSPKGAELAPLETSYMKYGQVGLVTAQGALVLGPPVESLRQTLDNLISHGETRIVLNLAGINRLD